MKLFSSILASALVLHLVHSVVIKINPIRIQVRPKHTTNTFSFATPSSGEISAQLRTTTDGLASNASFRCTSKTLNKVVTNQIATEQSLAREGSTENEAPGGKIAAIQTSGTKCKSVTSTTSTSKAAKYSLATESKMVTTLQPLENVSSIFLVPSNQSTTKGSFGGDSSTQYVNVTGDGVNATSKSPRIGSSCKIAFPVSTHASQDESTPPSKISDTSSRSVSTVELSSPKSSTPDMRPDFSPEEITEAKSKNPTEDFENADERQAISSSSSHSISSHSSSSMSERFDFPTILVGGSSSTVDSEAQLSAPLSVKTATPHSEGYPDFEKENQPYVSDLSTSQSTLRDDKKSSNDDKVNQEIGEITLSTVAVSQSPDSVTILQTEKNTSTTCKIAKVTPIIYNGTEMTRSQTISSTSSAAEESKLPESAAESTRTSDSSRNLSQENTESDQEELPSVPLEGEEDQIVTIIKSYWSQESVKSTSTLENKIQPNQLDHSSIASISVTAEQSTDSAGTTRAKCFVNQSHETSKTPISSAISIAESLAANITENYTTAFHRLTESNRAIDLEADNVSLSAPVSRPPTCKTTNTNQSWCGAHSCKTVLVQRTSTQGGLSEEEKQVSDLGADNISLSAPVSRPSTSETTNTNQSWCGLHSCKTVLVQRTSTQRALTEEEKKVRRLTISNKNPNLAKKMTRVNPLKGNISSNAGFLMVNRKYGARLFFWFVRSLHNATHAPVIVWLQGQPGWSSLIGLFEEHGPYRVMETETGIEIELREHAWTNEFNVLYLDHCIGCGYSTAKRKAAYEPTFEMVSANVYQALVQFFGVFSEYADNKVYLAGEHGCAKYIPVIADTIHSKNAIQQEHINLSGMLIGGPYIDAISMTSYYSEYLYVVGLIDEHEQEDLYIQEQYARSLILADKYNETIAYLKQNVYNKIEDAGYQRLYDLRYEKPMHGHYTFERYMQKLIKYEPFVSSIHAEGLQFRTQSELLIEEIMKPVDNILTTILQHYKVLYYNGQFDMLTPYSLTARYFSKLHWSQTDLFYSSQLHNWDVTQSGYPDGYWKFSSNLTHVMIRDAGHTVGTTKPQTLLFMLRWFVGDKFETPYAPPSPDQRYLNIFI